MNWRTESRFGSRVPELDGIRGIAILLVVLFHYLFGIAEEDSGLLARFFGAMLPLGWSGVDLFFVLSGFLIGGILVDNRESASYFKTFYTRRVCRIFPLYFVWLGIFVVLQRLFSASPHPMLVTLTQGIPHTPNWVCALFLQNFCMAKAGIGSLWMAPTWSLAVEEQFYLLLPLAIWIMPPRKRMLLLAALVAGALLIRIFLFLFHPELFASVLLPCRMDSLILGVICACLVRDQNHYTWLAHHRGALRLIFVLLLAGMVWLNVFAYGQPSHKLVNSFEMATFGFSWIALFYACLLLLGTIGETGVTAAVLRTPLLRHFGSIAYGMYLTHMPIKPLLQEFILGADAHSGSTLTKTLVALVAFLVTWMVAALSWRFFERPIVRWGHSFAYKTAETERDVNAAPIAPV